MKEHAQRRRESPVVFCRGRGGSATKSRRGFRDCALFHLINFDEPFGLSIVERCPAARPVIASNRGSIPELIDQA